MGSFNGAEVGEYLDDIFQASAVYGVARAVWKVENREAHSDGVEFYLTYDYDAAREAWVEDRYSQDR